MKLVGLALGTVLAVCGWSMPTVVETPRPGSGVTAIQVVVSTEGHRPSAALAALPGAILQGSHVFTAEAVQRYGTLADASPVAEVGEGWVGLRFLMPGGADMLDIGAELVGDLIKRPVFRTVPPMTGLGGDPFDPLALRLRRATPSTDDVRELGQRVLRPERIVIAFVGDFEPGEPTRLMNREFAAWTPATPPRRLLPAPDRGAPRSPVPADVYEFTWPVAGQDLATTAVTVTALGVGKGSALFQGARQSAGLSYLQEAALWPVDGRWTARLYVARRGQEDIFEAIDASLRAQVEAWTEEDAERARVVVRRALLQRSPLTPFKLGREPFAHWTQSEAAWGAFSAWMKTPGLTRELLAGAVENVDAQTMKLRALQILDEAQRSRYVGSE